jgi:hypothetical protein
VSDIFREIDEELRRDNLLKLWARYGRYVIAAAVLALLVAGLVVAWRDHQLALRQAQSARYTAAVALLRDGKNAEAAKLFGTIAGEGGGYAVLASFERAEALAKAGNRKAAAAIYEQIAASSAQPEVFRDLAKLLTALDEFPDVDPKAIVERVAPLTAKGNPWRPSALELMALARVKSDDRRGALALYKQLADDPSTPQGLRARAAEMAAALGS